MLHTMPVWQALHLSVTRSTTWQIVQTSNWLSLQSTIITITSMHPLMCAEMLSDDACTMNVMRCLPKHIDVSSPECLHCQQTSNMTGRHRGLKRKHTFVCRYVAPPGKCYYNTVLCCNYYFSSSSVVSCTFSVLCVYSTFGHHPHPLGYLCANFRLFRGLHYWASP